MTESTPKLLLVALAIAYWQAQHHALGVNFHNKRWIYADTIYLDPSGVFQFNPKAYAIKAFDLGSDGNILPLTISNEQGINLTAYAVRGARELFVTIINKEHGAGARAANVTIVAPGITGHASAIALIAPNGDVGAKTGVTLGGASISDGSWDGRWSELNVSKNGKTDFSVAAASALIVRVPIPQTN